MIAGRGVPLARRQLRAELAKLIVALVAIAAAVTLVLFLSGLRRGLDEQVTTYIDHQAPVLVGQRDARNFRSQTSVVSAAAARQVARVSGVADVAPITEGYVISELARQ
ncbi:MAG: hypothetical protein ABI783_06205 [Actinomycetota bacterium]